MSAADAVYDRLRREAVEEKARSDAAALARGCPEQWIAMLRRILGRRSGNNETYDHADHGSFPLAEQYKSTGSS